MRLRLSLLSAPLLAVSLLTGCAQTSVTWNADDTFEPLAQAVEVRLYVRASAPAPLRDALLERGAELVTAFPEGERVAEIATREATWLSWDTVIEEVRERARALGADRAMATGAASSSPGEHVLYFQLLRSPRHARE